MSGRIQKSAKNAKYGLMSQILYLVLMFAVRYMMIRYLGLTIFPHTSLDPTKVVRGSCGLRRMRSSNFCISGNHPNPSS